MSSSTLSSSFCVPLTFSTVRNDGVKPSIARFPQLVRRGNKNLIKAMVTADPRDNLDHLQRIVKPQQSQQPKKKTLQTAPIGLFDRFPNARTVQQMMETMERIMEDPLAYNNNNWSTTSSRDDVGGYRRGRTPWEIKEAENEYKMRFDMPGMTKNDVKVWVEEKMLVVKAEKKIQEGTTENEEDGEEWSANSYGKYNCRIALPENIDFEKIKAEVKDGVLYITIPKVSISTKVLDINVQ
ncbi:Small heat shock protein [Thalictrum thalictroides]|uniref:Small heat shock protein n=1 Tax=Thalictrum thalictroides TaxID=46969 RepID=A0A7J6VG59_THATH|nr:Small heat shock protein [Thalictrum thalictroides]